jgi:hypothetical protein
MTERERFVERELRLCEQAWQSGVSQAVADGLAWCERHKLPPPPWLCNAVRVLVERDVIGAADRKWDMIHYRRWDAVRELRDRKGEHGIPKTWPECFAAVSQHFEGTEAGGSAETIRASYNLVTKRMRSRHAHRYYLDHKKSG